MRVRTAVRCAAALGLSLLGWGCILPDLQGFGARPVDATHVGPTVVALASGAQQVTLQWQPAANAVPGSIWKYMVYYRRLGTWLTADTTWDLLTEVPASDSPHVVVDRKVLGDGTYEFAVTAVGRGGESTVHRSSDASARPASGWLLRWRAAP